MRACLFRACIFVLFLLPQLTLAHPGHSAIPADQPAHYLVTPEHAGAALVGVVAVGLAVGLLRRSRRRSRD